MAKHRKIRAMQRTCKHCGSEFVTGSNVKVFCSIECRVKDAAKAFRDVDDCWVWPGSKNPVSGYGQMMTYEGKKHVLYTAHRVSFTAFVGPINNGLHVLHKCDNRPCFNPAHLFLGTQKDNVDDMIAKGRDRHVGSKIHWTKRYPHLVKRGKDHHLSKDSSCLPRGQAHPNAKLKDEDVVAIRNSCETLAVLSDRYGLTQSSLSSIRNRKTWVHIV